MKELEEFNQKVKDELKHTNKMSKGLREIREKEHSLIKMQRYEEAESLKIKGDQIELDDKNKNENKIQLLICHTIIFGMATYWVQCIYIYCFCARILFSRCLFSAGNN